MPRPTRIEYEGAFYHVMNRGRGRQRIFHDKRYFEIFLAVLREASEQFDACLHAYCLMGNHYHLLIETPKANLGRIMRHINGVYTQRHNRLKQTDGPLFRGRYKAILVDQDAYLLQLSRYIHRNPVDMKRPLVVKLEDYSWSSYPAYIDQVAAPAWLHRELTYQILGHRRRYTGYAAYVAKGVDADIQRFYSKGNVLAVLGGRDFKQSIRDEMREVDVESLRAVMQDRPEGSTVIAAVSKVLKVAESELCAKPKGRRAANPARAFAMWACQYYGALSLKQLAEEFCLSNSGSASFSINRIKKEVAEGWWRNETAALEKCLNIVK